MKAKNQRKNRIYIIFFLNIFIVTSFANAKPCSTPSRWTVSAYYGRYTVNNFRKALIFNYGGLISPSVYGVSPSYQLPRNSLLSRWFHCLQAKPEIMGDITYLDDLNNHSVFQFATMLVLRWSDFPWNKDLRTSIAIGTGPSYSTYIPVREAEKFQEKENQRHLLNAVVFEMTFGLPEWPNVDFLYRISHRSGIFGLETPEIIDSNQLQFGVRMHL